MKWIVLLAALSCSLLAPASTFAISPTPTVEELFSYLGIDPARKNKMMAGEILSTPVDEGTDKELAVGIVMFVPAPVEKVTDFIRSGKVLSSDKTITAFGEIKDGADLAAFENAKFTAKQNDEAKSLLEVSAGSKFNLSADEIKACRAANPKNDPVKTASQATQKLLLERYRAFFKSGLAGIPTYDRGKKSVSPAEELRVAMKESSLLGKHFPELQKAALDFPANQPEGVINRFFWINQIVEKRPTFILARRMACTRPEGAIMVEQQFYVGHSYNSMQTISGCLAVPGGCLVFHSNHTSTDQVAGFGSGLRHSIGRDQMREETIASFEQMRAGLKK